MRAGNEIRPLTGLRGVTAAFVVVFHYVGTSSFTNPLTTFLDHGYLSVDLFFVLSGFVLALNYRHMFSSGWSITAYRTFLGRRIARIYPLYIVATLAGFALFVAGWEPGWGARAPHPPPLGVVLALNAAMIQVWGFAESFDPPAWSLSAEWAAYLLFPLLLVPTIFRKPQAAWACALTCATVLAILSWSTKPYHGLNDRELLNLYQHQFGLPVVRCIPEFTLGILAFRLAYTPFGLALRSSAWIAPAVTVVELVLLAIPGTDLAIVLLFPLLVVCLVSESHVPGRALASPPVEFLGTISYSIYLTHALFSSLLHWVHVRVHAAGFPHAQTVAAAVGIALTLPIAIFAYRTIEAPGRRLLRNLFEQPKKTPAPIGSARVAGSEG